MDKSNPNHKLDLLNIYEISQADCFWIIKFALEEVQKPTPFDQKVKVGCCALTTSNKFFKSHYISDHTGNEIHAEDFVIHKCLSEGELKLKALCIVYISEGVAQYKYPDGNWRKNFQHLGHFAMMSAWSEHDFIIKSSAALLPYSSVTFEESKELYYPDVNNITQLLNAAIHYCNIDFNEKHRHDIESLIQNEDFNALKKHFTPWIEFGTAGLRARMAGGYANMNFVTV